jgi:hypothetical protein
MKIASLIQSDSTTLSSIEPIKNNSTVTQNSTNDISNLINKNASDYFDLGVDISGFIKVDTVQDKTNKELVGYLTSIIDNKSPEGKKNLEAYDIKSKEIYFLDFQKDLEKMGGLEYLQKMSKQFEKLDKLYNKDNGLNLSKLYKEDSHVNTESLMSAIERGAPNVGTYYYDTFREITKEESKIIDLEKFKNLYSFSEDFAQTQKFQDLYQEYKKQRSELDFESIGVKANITSEVAKKNLSKSEVIEYYTGISNDLKDKLVENSSKVIIGALGKSEIGDTIKLYDKIISDLKDIWGFGDLDIHI